MLQQSEGKDDIIISNTMKESRLINRHWSSWATRAIGVLRPPNVPLETLLEMVAEKFVDARSITLYKIRNTDDEDVVTL